jgi:hypothetical protein
VMKPYSRQQPPDGMNHADFGVACPVINLSDSRATVPFGRTIRTYAPIDLPRGRSWTPELETKPVDFYLQACRVELADCVTGEFEATVFPPNHAVFASGPGGGFLLDESLWHSDLFFSDWFRNDQTTQWRWRARRDWRPFARITAPVNYCYHIFQFQYFHWLIDCLPFVWLLKTRGNASKSAKWAVGPLRTPMHVACLRLFDIRPEDCVWLDFPVVEFSHLICAGFNFREPLKTRPSYHDGLHHRGWWPDYLNDLRDRAVTRHGKPGAARDLKLYITREDTQHRLIVNNAEVDALIEEYGFVRVTPGLLPFEQQVAIFSRARVIVGTHGAGMTNAIWAAPGAKLLEFMPSPLGDPGYRFLGQLCGHEYGCLFVKCMDHPRGVAFANIVVDVGLLRAALNEITG